MPYLLDFKFNDNARPDGVDFDEEEYKYKTWIYDENGNFVSSGGLSQGFRYGPEVFPPKVKVYKGKKYFEKHPVFCFGADVFVPELFINTVESLEPDVHQYIPVSILDNDDIQVEINYYRLNICNILDALNLQQSSITEEMIAAIQKNRPNFVQTDFSNIEGYYGQPNIVLNRESISEAHLWKDKNFEIPFPSFFVSDVLFEKLVWTRRVWNHVKIEVL